MFSHVLSNYQSSFLTFVTKVRQTLEATSETMKATPQYEFCVLKELSQNLGEGVEGTSEAKELVPQDKDQMLFFQVILFFVTVDRRPILIVGFVKAKIFIYCQCTHIQVLTNYNSIKCDD